MFCVRKIVVTNVTQHVILLVPNLQKPTMVVSVHREGDIFVFSFQLPNVKAHSPIQCRSWIFVKEARMDDVEYLSQ